MNQMTTLPTTTYDVAFTAGGLLLRESLILAERYRQLGDWQAVRLAVCDENLLQARTVSSMNRVGREVVQRLQTLRETELEFLLDASPQEQAWLLWVAICRRYALIADFAVEVLRERYLSLKADLNFEDFDAFFHHKADWHPALESVRPVTRDKLRQVLFRMLREAGLLGSNHMIHAAMLSPPFIALIRQEIQGSCNTSLSLTPICKEPRHEPGCQPHDHAGALPAPACCDLGAALPQKTRLG